MRITWLIREQGLHLFYQNDPVDTNNMKSDILKKCILGIAFITCVSPTAKAAKEAFETELVEFSAKLDKLEGTEGVDKALKEIFLSQAVIVEETFTSQLDSTERICSPVEDYVERLAGKWADGQNSSVHRSILAAGFSPDKSSAFLIVKCTDQLTKKSGGGGMMALVYNQTIYLRRVDKDLKIVALSTDFIKSGAAK